MILFPAPISHFLSLFPLVSPSSLPYFSKFLLGMLSPVTALSSSAASSPVSARTQPRPQTFLKAPRNCVHPQGHRAARLYHWPGLAALGLGSAGVHTEGALGQLLGAKPLLWVKVKNLFTDERTEPRDMKANRKSSLRPFSS